MPDRAPTHGARLIPFSPSSALLTHLDSNQDRRFEACRKKGHKIVVVLGHTEFYPRFGFSAELAQPLESPFGGGEAWMAMELVSGALAGVEGRVEYPPPFEGM